MTRERIHAGFAAEFQRGPHAARVAAAELDALEQKLGLLLPEACRTFLLAQGAIATPAIPGMVTEIRADQWPAWTVNPPPEHPISKILKERQRLWDLWPVSGFCAPTAALAATRAVWKSGRPRSLVVFAQGPGETLFLVEGRPVGRRRADDAAVWAFDPGAGELLRLTDSFDAWLQEYLDAVCEVDEVEDQEVQDDEVAERADGE